MADVNLREFLARPSTSASEVKLVEITSQHDSRTSSSSSRDAPPAPSIEPRTILAIFAVCLIYYAQLVNLVGVGAQTQQIAQALDGTNKSIWLSSPLAISTVILSPIIAQASDHWGRKWLLVTLNGFGVIGSLTVARADSMGMAIAGFALTGLSYGAQPLLHAVTAEVLPRRWRSWGQAADLVAGAMGGITALLVGGALERDGGGGKRADGDVEGFRYFWYFTMVVFLLATILTAFLYTPPPTKKQQTLSQVQRLQRLDWIGYALLIIGLILLSIGLSWSENPYPWTDAHTCATFTVGVVFLIALVVYEIYFKVDGMFHHGLFRHKNFAIVLVCIFCEGLAFFAANQYYSFQTSVFYETDSLLVGLRYSVSLFVSIPAALLAGLYCSMMKRVRWITALALLVFAIFFAAMATSGKADSSKALGLSVLLGVALGTTLCALITVAQLSTPKELIAVATGLVIGMRSFGGAIGLAIYNVLFVDRMTQLGASVASAVVPLGLDPRNMGLFMEAFLSHDNESLRRIPNVTPGILSAAADVLLDTYESAFRNIWIAAGCFVLVAAIAAIFLEDPREEFTMRVDAPLHVGHHKSGRKRGAARTLV